MNAALARLATAVALHCNAEDKRLHAIWSFGLMLAAGVALPLSWAVAVVALIGLGKECWDQYFGTGFCWIDLLANGVGIAAAALLLLALPDWALWRPWLA